MMGPRFDRDSADVNTELLFGSALCTFYTSDSGMVVNVRPRVVLGRPDL